MIYLPDLQYYTLYIVIPCIGCPYLFFNLYMNVDMHMMNVMHLYKFYLLTDLHIEHLVAVQLLVVELLVLELAEWYHCIIGNCLSFKRINN